MFHNACACFISKRANLWDCMRLLKEHIKGNKDKKPRREGVSLSLAPPIPPLLLPCVNPFLQKYNDVDLDTSPRSFSPCLNVQNSLPTSPIKTDSIPRFQPFYEVVWSPNHPFHPPYLLCLKTGKVWFPCIWNRVTFLLPPLYYFFVRPCDYNLLFSNQSLDPQLLKSMEFWIILLSFTVALTGHKLSINPLSWGWRFIKKLMPVLSFCISDFYLSECYIFEWELI